MKKYYNFFLPFFIFILALGIRFYDLPARFTFTADEEYQATYARTVVQDFHPIWIGVSAGDTGFYLGSYFTYFTALWLAVGKGDPLVTGYVAATLGALTSVILFYLGKRIGGTKVGVVASLFYVFSPLIVYFDQRFWNPTPIPFLVCLLLLGLVSLKAQKWWLVVISLCLGVIWHVHLSLVPLYLISLWVIWKEKAKLALGPWVVSVLLFIFMLLPLIIFDYNHAWSNVLTPARLLSAPDRSLDLSGHMAKFGATLARFNYLTPGLTNNDELRDSCVAVSTKPTNLVIFLSLIPLIIFLLQKKNWKDPTLKIISLSFLLLSTSFILYPGPISAYYALGLIPLYFLILAVTLKRFGWLVSIIFVVLSVRTLFSTDTRFGLTAKHDLINQVISTVGSDSFNLQEDGECHKYGGWRYLFLSYGHAPSTSSTDSPLGWLYPKEIGSPGKYLVEVGATGEFTLPLDSIAVYESGGYTAVITYAK